MFKCLWLRYDGMKRSLVVAERALRKFGEAEALAEQVLLVFDGRLADDLMLAFEARLILFGPQVAISHLASAEEILAGNSARLEAEGLFSCFDEGFKCIIENSH
mgnify:CR=1 FL=1